MKKIRYIGAIFCEDLLKICSFLFKKVSPDELLTRQEYLKEQRDKIVEIKKRTRAKQLRETVSCNGPIKVKPTSSVGRPSSAQMAQKLLENVSKSNTVLEQPEECETNNALQLRKTLAKRLKAEVVEQN